MVLVELNEAFNFPGGLGRSNAPERMLDFL